MNKSIKSKQKWTVYHSSLIFGASVVLLVSFVFVRSRKWRKKSVLDCVATETKIIVIRDSENLEQYIIELGKDLATEIFCGHQVLGQVVNLIDLFNILSYGHYSFIIKGELSNLMSLLDPFVSIY